MAGQVLLLVVTLALNSAVAVFDRWCQSLVVLVLVLVFGFGFGFVSKISFRKCRFEYIYRFQDIVSEIDTVFEKEGARGGGGEDIRARQIHKISEPWHRMLAHDTHNQRSLMEVGGGARGGKGGRERYIVWG